MKEPEKLIREYYATNGITHGAPLLFSYVRKSTTGGDWAVLEYYAAKYGHVKGKKGKDIAVKLVMKFNPDTMRCSMSDSVIRYTSWSSLSINHLIFDFHKEISGSRDYGKRTGIETGGNVLGASRNWKDEIMPTSEIPLNDFSGTKYEYCKYRYKDEDVCNSKIHHYSYWGYNPYGNLPDYLRKFNINPRAMEMFASRGLTKFMKEPFLLRLRDDKPFAKWYRSHALATLGWSITNIENAARKDIGSTCYEICRREERRLERIAKKRRDARRARRWEREEIRRKKEAEEMERKERKSRALRILNLYKRLKFICCKFGAYDVVVPKSEREMKQEGLHMHNCIGRMYPSRQGVNAIVLFLHKNGKPCVDIEINPETFAVVQCRAACNKDADDGAHRIASELASIIQKTYRKAA